MLALGALVILNAFILAQTNVPEELTIVKQKYKTLREHLVETKNEKFRMLWREKPITGYLKMSDSVGWNTNKGQEIAICLDGTPNQIMHVLIHELAHCTVNEYSHSKEFGRTTSSSEISPCRSEFTIAYLRFCGQRIQDGA